MVRVAAWRFAEEVENDVVPLDRSITGQVIRDRRILHKPDLAGEPDLPESVRDRLRRQGNVSVVHVPLLWQDRGIGQLMVARTPPKPFSEKELSLLQTFADQAVIAIENARLFNETREALERQIATSEVLQTISNSISDAKPVFERILESTERLIDCKHSGIYLIADEKFHCAAARGPDAAVIRANYPVPLAETPAPEIMAQRRQLIYPSQRT